MHVRACFPASSRTRRPDVQTADVANPEPWAIPHLTMQVRQPTPSGALTHTPHALTRRWMFSNPNQKTRLKDQRRARFMVAPL